MTDYEFKVGDEVIYDYSEGAGASYEHRIVWGVSPSGATLWLKPPTQAPGSSYIAHAEHYKPYVRELKVGDKVRYKKTFSMPSGEARHVGCAEPKHIRYISKELVVFETTGSNGSSYGESALDRNRFDETFELDPT